MCLYSLAQQVLYHFARNSPQQNAFPRRKSRVAGRGTKRSFPATSAQCGRGPRVFQLHSRRLIVDIWPGCHASDSRDIRCISELCYSCCLAYLYPINLFCIILRFIDSTSSQKSSRSIILLPLRLLTCRNVV
jgi:hypothetical protein